MKSDKSLKNNNRWQSEGQLIIVIRYNIYIRKNIYDNKYVKKVASHTSPIVKLLWMITIDNNNQFKFLIAIF